MKSRMKRSIAVMLSLIMLLSAVPVGTLAEILTTDCSPGFGLGDIGVMSIVIPPAASDTYEFWDGTTRVDTQIVVTGDKLIEPSTPATPAGKKFTGWYLQGAASPIDFAATLTVTAPGATIRAGARYTDIWYVYFVYDGKVIATSSHWSATPTGGAYNFSTPIIADRTLYAVWTANTNTRYTLVYWQENADDEGYTFVQAETRYGTSGSTITVAPNDIRNNRYVYFSYEKYDQNKTIAGEGSTIVNIYYSSVS